jgi:hypothetical protein
VKLSFGIIVFNGDYVLRENLSALYPCAHEIVITEGPVKHNQKLGFTSSTDQTVDIIKSFPDPQNKIRLISGKWENKDQMCNVYLKGMTGDYVWHIDADELYLSNDIEKVIKYLENNKNCYSMSFRLYSFYGGFERYVSGFDENFEVHRIQKFIPGKSVWKTHRPPTMIWPPSGKTCREMGHVDYKITSSWGIRIYHYSYVFPKQVKEKCDYYQKRFSGLIPDYWNKLFVPWMKADTDEDKRIVEKPTQGVHMWLPHRRGPAFTKKFPGQHPETIEKARPVLEQRISDERKKLGI